MMPIEAKFQGYVAFVSRSRLQIPPDQRKNLKKILNNELAIKGVGSPTRLLPHAKMLLIPINFFFLCWVDYALESSIFSLSKCDFKRMFHAKREYVILSCSH